MDEVTPMDEGTPMDEVTPLDEGAYPSKSGGDRLRSLNRAKNRLVEIAQQFFMSIATHHSSSPITSAMRKSDNDHRKMMGLPSPMCRLSKTLFPLLRHQLNNLVRSVDLSNLTKDPRRILEAALQDVGALACNLFDIDNIIDQCWDPDDFEESEFEDLEYRRFRQKRQHSQLKAQLCGSFVLYHQYWQAVDFLQDGTPVQNPEKAGVAPAIRSACEHITVIIRFLENPLFDAINGDLQGFSGSVGAILARRVCELGPVHENYLEHPTIALLKLSRAFLNKISKPTNHDIILFRRMSSNKLVPLLRAAVYIPYWVERLDKRTYLNSHMIDEVMGAIARVIATFNKCLQYIDPFLESPPHDVHPSVAQDASQWFKVWYYHLFIALQHISDFVGCDFPSPDLCHSVQIDPFDS